MKIKYTSETFVSVFSEGGEGRSFLLDGCAAFGISCQNFLMLLSGIVTFGIERS